MGRQDRILGFDEILRRYPSYGPQEPEGNPALVTDDTQMALAVGEALVQAERLYTAQTLEGPLRRAFIQWSNPPKTTALRA